MSDNSSASTYSETLQQNMLPKTNTLQLQHQLSGLFIHSTQVRGLDDQIVLAIQRKTNIRATAIVDLPPTPQRRSRAFQVVFSNATELARVLAVGTYQFAGGSHRIQPMSVNAITISSLRVDAEIPDSDIDDQLQQFGKIIQPTKKIMDRVEGFGSIHKGKRITIIRPSDPNILPPSTLTIHGQSFPIIYTLPGLNISNLQRDKIDREERRNAERRTFQGDNYDLSGSGNQMPPHAVAPPFVPTSHLPPSDTAEASDDELPVHPKDRANRRPEDRQPPEPTELNVLPETQEKQPQPPVTAAATEALESNLSGHSINRADSQPEPADVPESDKVELFTETVSSDSQLFDSQPSNTPPDSSCELTPSSPSSQDVIAAVRDMNRSPYTLRKTTLSTRGALESVEKSSLTSTPSQCDVCGLDETCAVSHEKCRGVRVPWDKSLTADRRCPHGTETVTAALDSFHKSRVIEDGEVRATATRKCADVIADMYLRAHPKYTASIMRHIGAFFGDDHAATVISFANTAPGCAVDIEKIQMQHQHHPGIVASLESEKLLQQCSNSYDSKTEITLRKKTVHLLLVLCSNLNL